MKHLNFNFKSIVQSKARWLLTLFAILTLSVGQMWAYWHVPGTHASTGWTSADGNESCMDGSNYVTFYAVAAGTYEFKLVKGGDWGHGNFTNKSSSIITALCSNCSNGNNKFTINCIADVTFHITNEGNWDCDVSAVASSYFIKYPWGEDHAWTFSAPMTACSDGTYACTGPYNGTTYDFGRRGYAGGAGAKTGQTATVNNSPSTDETCVFNVTTSGALTITRCNKVTATNKIYFDNSVSNFTGNIYLIIGHDKPTKYSCAYKMTQLAGTKLHYVSIDANWTDATYYAIVGNTAASISAGSWGSGDLSSKQTGGYSAAYTGKYDLAGSNKQYLFTTSSSGNNEALTITYKNTGYSNLNYAQSVTLCTKAYGAATYSANTSSLTSLNFTTYNLTAVGTVSTQQTNNMNGSTGVASGNACQAATTTINVGDAPASWVYDGIYTGMNSGSQVEDEQTYTYYPTAATNYYVRFHEVHDPSVSLAASSSYLTTTSGLRALTGETITLTATALYNVNALVYTYEYSTNSGSSWTTIASRSASNTQTFVANSTGDYIFRVTLPDEAGTVNGTTNVHMTEMYRIKVKKNSSWTPNKLYVWNKSTEITQYGAFPGSTGKFTNHGQWYEFDLNSDFDSFIVSASDHNSNRTADVNNVSSDGCYTINSGTGTSVGVTSGASCPTAPTSVTTTNAPTLLQNDNATFAGSIGTNGNDDITSYGFKWGTSSDASNNTAQIATSDHTGSISKKVTGLTANTTYYYKAYATNAYGTSYGTIYSFTTPYKVTITKPTGCSAMTPGTGSQYVKVGDNITATKATGYTFSSWSTTNVTLGDPSTVAGVTTSAITAISADNGTITASYTENMTTITITANNKAAGSVTVGGADFEWDGTTTAGVATTRALVVTAAPGYYFSGWTRSDGADFHLSGYGEANTSVTLTGDGAGETSGQTLTANFTELEKIYFRDVFDDGSTVTHWGDVYVYLGITWNGSNQAVTNSSHDDWRIHMTQIKGTNVWWAYVPRNFTTAAVGTKEKVGFAKTNQNGRSYTFYNTKAATRGDYNKALNMFVPYHTAKTTGNNGVDYFDNGYWMKYDTRANNGAGYYLKKFNSKNNYTQEGEFIATSDDATFIQFDLRIDAANSTLKYMITSAGNLNYVSDAAVTSSNCTNVGVSENLDKLSEKEVYFSLTTTSEGIYSFVLDQSGDKMKLNVIYPVSVGDYRLKHTYNDGSAKTTYSDIIKSSGASTPRTLSMYLSTAGSETLVLQKCTLITAGVAQWTAGDATNLSGVLTTVGDNYGVYQFDVAVSADKVASAPTATKYTGPYYIKTNGATGGWANYKQNFMDENTINYDTDHPENSFNYYYCKYYKDAGTNLKCVIANDYCNALTDTLIGDAVIGMGNQTTPSAASVRFSYNTYTNEIKRAYLGATLAADFLLIRGNTAAGKPHIYDNAETTYDDSHADASIKFEDKQNWRYEIDVKADVNAHAKLTAGFNSQTQYFMGAAGTSGHEWDDENTELLFGGQSGTYGLTLVYDFKTNKLIRAWRPTGDAVNADLTLKSDVLLLREHQGAPTAITFGLKDASNYASLKEVKTVYSVLRFNRWRLGNRANPTDVDPEHCNSTANINTYHRALNPGDAGYLSDHERELYFISFPYDVKMSDIIHFGGYYDKWGIMYYDGKGRAKNGYWIDSESNWKYFTLEEFATKTLNAYEGYLIGIDLAQMGYSNTSFWTNNSSEVDIYFPSKEAVSTITQHAVTVNIDTTGYKCTINRDFGGDDGDRRIKDSHWHCIGVPSYADLSHAINNGEPEDENWTNKELLYLYEWNTETNDHSIKKATSFSFQAMYAYLVQYAGTTLSWTAAAATGPVSIAARHIKTEELRDRQFNLYLLQGDKEADHTYIRLSDDEEVTSGFEFNHDVSKMMLNGANIYTLIDKEQAAANSLPLNLEETTVVPVGVKIVADGEYSFSIPEGTEGIGVVLIDNLTGARTNLALTDYEVSLTAGKIEGRFSLEISPIKNTPTGIDLLNGENGANGARKVIVDGMLYIVRDGEIYDAQGKRVK